MVELGVLLGLAAAASWGFTDFLIKKIVAKADQKASQFIMQVVGLIVLLPLLAMNIPSLPLWAWALIAFCGLLNFIAYSAYFKGLSQDKLSIMAPITGGFGAVTAILGLIILHESLVGMQGIGVFLVVIGTVLIALEKKEDIRQIAKGAPLGLIALFSWGLAWFLIAFVAKQFEASVIGIVFGERAVTVLLLTASTPNLGRKVVESFRVVPLMLLGIGIFDAAGFIITTTGFKYGAAALIAPVASLYPAFAMVLGAIFLKERLQRHQYIGALCALIGLFLALV